MANILKQKYNIFYFISICIILSIIPFTNIFEWCFEVSEKLSNLIYSYSQTPVDLFKLIHENPKEFGLDESIEFTYQIEPFEVIEEVTFDFDFNIFFFNLIFKQRIFFVILFLFIFYLDFLISYFFFMLFHDFLFKGFKIAFINLKERINKNKNYCINIFIVYSCYSIFYIFNDIVYTAREEWAFSLLFFMFIYWLDFFFVKNRPQEESIFFDLNRFHVDLILFLIFFFIFFTIIGFFFNLLPDNSDDEIVEDILQPLTKAQSKELVKIMIDKNFKFKERTWVEWWAGKRYKPYEEQWNMAHPPKIFTVDGTRYKVFVRKKYPSELQKIPVKINNKPGKFGLKNKRLIKKNS